MILNIASALLIGSLLPILSHWLEVPILTRKSTLREPTTDELRRIQSLSNSGDFYSESPIYVLEEEDELRAGTLIVGLPGRRMLLIGSEFFEQGEEFIKAALALQESLLENGVYNWKLIAKTVRFQLLCVLLLYLFPPISPAPEGLPALLLIMGTIGTLLLFDLKIRSLTYQSDRKAALLCSPKYIEEILTTVVDQTEIEESPSRIVQHFRFSPSIKDRIKNLRDIHDN